MRRARHRPQKDLGFTLVEVLAAFSILAMSLGVLLAVFSDGLRNAAIAVEYSRAIVLAESKLAQAGVTEALVPGEQEGAFDQRYHWRQTASALPVAGQPHACQVSIQVAWMSPFGRRSVELQTLRLSRLCMA